MPKIGSKDFVKYDFVSIVGFIELRPLRMICVQRSNFCINAKLQVFESLVSAECPRSQPNDSLSPTTIGEKRETDED